MRFIIHIGYPKTGSTTIQSALFYNRGRLKALDILYPQSVNQRAAHHPLARFAEPDASVETPRFRWIERRPDAELAEALSVEVEAAACSKVILSSEAFVTMASPDALISLISPWASSIEVLVFVRRQDQHVESAFSQLLKMGAIDGDPNDYVAKTLKNRLLDYNFRLEPWWDRVDGNLKVVPIESDVRKVDVMDVIREVCDIRGPLQLSESLNARLGRDALELLGALPDKDRTTRQRTLSFRALGAWSKEHPDPAGWEHFFSYEQRLELYDRHRESNAALAARCGLDQLFVGEPKPAENEYPGLSVERAAEIAEWLLEHGAAADKPPQTRLVEENPRPVSDPTPPRLHTGLRTRTRRALQAFRRPI